MYIDLFGWNVRGFNKVNHRTGFKKWFKQHRPSFGCLLETHVQRIKQNKFVTSLLPGWGFDGNYEFSELGKIWILWHPSLQVSIIQKSLQMITCLVKHPGYLSPVIVSCIYASTDEDIRKELWSEIICISTHSEVQGKSWLLVGDFNQILKPQEHSRPPTLNVDRKTREFQECISDAALSDLSYTGPTFSWWNSQKANPIGKKLDRILVNDQWLVQFPSSLGVFGPPQFSDHTSMSVILESAKSKHRIPFRFYNFLLLDGEFLPMIAWLWFSTNIVGSEMFRVSKKLKALKNPIRSFNRDHYSNLEKRAEEAQTSLNQIQQDLLSSPSVALAEAEAEAQRKLGILLNAEQVFLFQRSNISWLNVGDCGSHYFHKIMATRRSQNHIHLLIGPSGEKFETREAIHAHCLAHFADFLGSTPTMPLFDPQDITLLLNYNCPESQCDKLQEDFSDEEIKDAFFNLPRNKSCGPDGFSSEFFIGCWSIIGPEITSAVKEFFREGKLLRQWNSTLLVLIPKIRNASKIGDFRPISCLNTLYKVISRLLTGRLKEVLSPVISHAQSAFMPGRLLAENVLLATELIQGYKRKNISPRAMLKVDLRKAFDSIRWDFVLASLRAIGLPHRFINWISECISSASFTICINGEAGGYFKSSRGLRQGDPLSPYLFVLAMEVFSRLLKSRYASGYIEYHPSAKPVDISHLMFADDVMVFYDGSSSSLHGISETLDDFAMWSGLEINHNKSELFTAGLSQLETITSMSYGFPIGTLPIRYLGLPLMHRKLRISEYSPLLDKIAASFNAWSARHLSFAGRLVLIKSVISGTVVFWITTFILPKGCIKKIESLCSKFLWSGQIEGPAFTKISWATCCLPKQEGGLGLRRYETWNKTLCLRLIWLLFAEGGSLWVAWHKHHHLNCQSFWELTGHARDSWHWKSLLKLRQLARPYIVCTVQNGRSASFWFDQWTPLGALIDALGPTGPRTLRIPLQATVSEATSDDFWNLPAPRSDEAVALHAYLTNIPVPSGALDSDFYSWTIEGVKFQSFSSSKTWSTIRERQQHCNWYNVVWFKGNTPKHAFHMWVAVNDRLPTRSRLAAWGMLTPTTCCLCMCADESRDHIFIECPFSKDLWRMMLQKLSSPRLTFHSWTQLLNCPSTAHVRPLRILRSVAVQAIVYNLWTERNSRIFKSKVLTTSELFKIVDRQVRNTISARKTRKHFKNLMAVWLI
ncbi:hypothetical protein YC2023_022825 [Brassica napus]